MSFISAILTKFLDQYIEKVDKSQVNVSIMKGHAELKDISFTPNLLSSFGFPLTIKSSRVGQIILDFPIMNNPKETALLKAINVDLYAIPDWSALNKVSINSVADLIQSMEDEKKATKADKRKAWDNWFERVIDSATIDIRNVRLHIEFQNWDRTTSALTLFFESLKMNTIDSAGNVVVLKTRPDILTKRIILSSFSIAEYQKVEPFDNFDKLNNIEYNFLKQNSFTFTMIHDRRKNSAFFNSFKIVFDPILFDLTQQQYFALQYLISDLSKSRIRQKFQSCMRPLSEKMNDKYYIKMWCYLFRCAIKIRRPVEFKPDVALQFLKKRKEYAQSFMRSINKKQYVKKSIKNYGDDLTYLLIQYSAILMRKKDRMIKFDKEDIDSITSEDLTFFSKDSFSLSLTVQGICLKIPSFVLVSINDINLLFEKKRENINVNLNVSNWLIDDLNKGYQIIQINDADSNNFFNFKLESLDEPAFLDVSKFKIDFRSSFLNMITQFFTNDKLKKIKMTRNDNIELNSSIISNSSIINLAEINEDTTTTEDATDLADDDDEEEVNDNEDDADSSDDEIDAQEVKSSSINQILMKLNPKTLLKFNIMIRGFQVSYTTDNEDVEHSITGEIEQIQLQNYSESSNETILSVKSKMLFGPIKVDDAIISEEFSLETSTLGVIDKYYFLGDLVTKFDILNAKIDVNSNIIDKVSNILMSLKNNTQSGFTKTYSDHKICANCSNISVILDTGINTLVLSIGGMNMNPTIEITDIIILDNNDPQITIPSLCFNKWPIIETDLLKINLNSYEFFNFLDEVGIITKQMTQLTNAFLPAPQEKEVETNISLDENKKEPIQVISRLIDYKMGDNSNSVKLNNVVIILTDSFNLKIDSLGLYDSDDKQFLFCNNEISMSMDSSEVRNIISINIPCLKMNFLWKNVNEMINYFQDSRAKIKKSLSENINDESAPKKNQIEMVISIQNDNASISIDETYILQVEKLKFDFAMTDKPKINLGIQKTNIDNLFEINNFNFQIESGYIFDISVSTINANLSEAKAAKIFNLSFINGVVELAKKYHSDKNKDFNVNIKDFTFIESSTDLHLIIPVVKFTLNTSHSIGALHIPSIKAESLVLDNIKLFLLFDSIDYNTNDIDSVFLLDRPNKPNDQKPKLTNLIVNINSIDFDYAHYFMMRVFNSWRIYSKFIFKTDKQKDEEEDTKESEVKISGIINQINIKERNLTDTISLITLTFEKSKELTEFKCSSINCIELIKVGKQKENSNFFIIQQTKSKTNISINPIDVYLNINTMKTLTNINESLSSLIKTDFDEKLNQSQDKEKEVVKDKKEKDQSTELSIECNGIQVHLPFEDDPLFQKHDLIISFNLSSDIHANSYKSFSLTNLKIFFTNYQKQMNFLPIFNNGSFLIKIHDNNTDDKDFDFSLLEIETGDFNINLSVLDIFELQMIVNNFRKSFTSLLNPQTCSIPDQNPNQKKLVLTAMNSTILIKPINISLCEENRASLIYNPIFTLNIEAKSSTLNLQNQNQSFSIDLVFSIKHLNLLEGKFESFMTPTDIFISYSKGDSNTAYFGFSIKSAIDFNITPYSFGSIMRFIKKFNNKEQILLLKNESKFNYKPEFWVKNNLNNGILIKYHKQEEYRKAESELYVTPSDNLPMCEFHKDSLVTFQYKNIEESFSPRNLVFPIFFKTISVSTVSHENYSQSIVFNSPLSIQNKLDFKVLIYIKTETDFKKFVELMPKGRYPLYFEEKQYLFFSDYVSIIEEKAKRKFMQKKKPEESPKPKIDSNNLPEMFSMSLRKVPRVISIQNHMTKKSTTFAVKVVNDPRSNTRVFEIVPSYCIKNLLPCPIMAQLYNRDNTKINENPYILQSLDERQVNLINYDTQAIQIALSFDISQFQKSTMIRLDNFNEIFACGNSIAIRMRKKIKSDQREIVIFTPCAIFNNTEETIYFSPSSSKTENKTILPNNFAFYGLDSYEDSDKSMKIDISIKNSQKILKAIDCLRLNSNCTTINLPRIDNPRLFYPINCSITLGQYPMNLTHVITFTPYLYVVNHLPFDFSLVPITSSKMDSIESYYDKIDVLHHSIEDEAKSYLKDSFICRKSSASEENCIPIKWVSKEGMFLFSVSKYSNIPIIQLNRITRTIFLIKNKKQLFYVELNIYEDKSTFYAHFQVPSYPVPLVINNSLDTPIVVYQNIKPCKNKLLIGANTSSLFAFDEPFINNKKLYIEIHSEKKKDNQGLSYIPYLFSMEEQLSPLISTEDDFIISTTIISSNNSKMIYVHRKKDVFSYTNSFRGFLSINSFNVTLSKNKMNEIARFSMRDILAEFCQDTKNSYITLSLGSIQLDNQSTDAKIPVCMVGTGKNLLNKDEKTDKFVKFYSIFPRGVPLFTMINFMSIQIQPIFIIPESSLIANIVSFFTSIFKNKSTSSSGAMIIEPSFNSVTINRTMIAYLELYPISFVINIPNEARNDRDSIANAMRYMNMFSLNRFAISVPKLFVSEFNDNISYLVELFRDFYGNEIMKQVAKNAIVKMVTSSLIRFKKLHFTSLSQINNKVSTQNLCDNRKQIFGYFNQIELNDVAHQTMYYFNKSPDVINLILDKQTNPKVLSTIHIHHPKSDKSNEKHNKNCPTSNKDRLILGIMNDPSGSNVNNADLVHIFKANGIKRVRMHPISPIYSSFYDDVDDSDASKVEFAEQCHMKIQQELLKNKMLQTQVIKFIIKSKKNDLICCVTNEMILIFENFKFLRDVKLITFKSVSASGSIVTLDGNDANIDHIDIDMNTEENAKMLESFINTQKTVISIFGKNISSS